MTRLSLPMLAVVLAFAAGAAAQTPQTVAPSASAAPITGSSTSPMPTPASSAGSAPAVRVQYDQVHEFLDHGMPIPPPDAFEQEYAKVKATVPPSPPSRAEGMAMGIATLAEDQVQQRFMAWARGKAASLLGGLISANPLAGMVAGRLLSAADAKMQNATDRLSEQQQNAMALKLATQSLRALPGLQRISIWGDWVRIDNPHDHSAIVYKPDLGRYLVIDNVHEEYRIVKGPAPTHAPLSIICDQPGTMAPLGASTMAGVPVHGYRAITVMSLDDMTTTHTQTLYFWDQPIPPRVLELATGDATCPADSPVGQRYPQDRLALYVATDSGQTSDSGEDDSNSAWLNKVGLESVEWRGHVRMLTDADRALFEPPAGYQQVQ